LKNARNKLSARRLSILTWLVLLLSSYGCASQSGKQLVLHPAKYRMEGYTRSADQWTFENQAVTIRVRHIRPGWGGTDARASVLVGEFHKRNYLILRLVIRNDSDFDIIYNPALTTFKSGALGYKKPLDYTDLYSIFAMDSARGDLKDYSRFFYDLSATIRPGGRSAKFLAFKTLDKGARKGKLTIKNLYVDKEIINLGFPFILKTEE
jgi:hypothetical protein